MKRISKNHRYLIVTITIILVLICSVLVVGIYVNSKPPSNPTSTSDASSEQVNQEDNSNDESTSTNNDPPTDQQSEGGGDIKEDSLGQDETSSKLSLVITSVDVSQEELRVRTLINKVTTKGICSLSLTHGDTVITQSSTVQPVTSYSTCEGFSINTSEMESGTWTITISYDDGTTTATATKQVEV